MNMEIGDKHSFISDVLAWAKTQPQTLVVATWIAWAQKRLEQLKP